MDRINTIIPTLAAQMAPIFTWIFQRRFMSWFHQLTQIARIPNWGTRSSKQRKICNNKWVGRKIHFKTNRGMRQAFFRKVAQIKPHLSSSRPWSPKTKRYWQWRRRFRSSIRSWTCRSRLTKGRSIAVLQKIWKWKARRQLLLRELINKRWRSTAWAALKSQPKSRQLHITTCESRKRTQRRRG